MAITEGPVELHEDLDVLSAGLPDGTAAVVVLLEHRWAADLARALDDAGGGVVASEWLTAPLRNSLADTLT